MGSPLEDCKVFCWSAKRMITICSSRRRLLRGYIGDHARPRPQPLLALPLLSARPSP